MSIELRPITRENWKEAIRLEVDDAQRYFVANNLYSIAQSKFYPTWEPMAIYHDGTMVGFVMWGNDPEGDEDGAWWFIRLMVDQAHQGNGYGKAGMVEALRRIKARPGCKAVYVSFVPENAVAQRLYTGLGFEDTGQVDDGEVVYRIVVGTSTAGSR